jgi:arsenite-transporting ATPase
MTRILLYTGKGGVGKTTVAAATALSCAERGYRTLAISTDAAHSLSDSFDLSIGEEPRSLAANLWGQETDLSTAINDHWTVIQSWISSLLAWRGLRDVVADEMAFLPGMEELANLLYIATYARSGHYDTLVVDSAPTGETLRLLSFPEMLNWWMKRLFPIERRVATAVRPVLKTIANVPVPGDEVLNSIEQLFGQLEEMRAILTDPAKTSIRLVLNPEKMVIKETQRTFTYLNLYGYAVDLIVCNRMIPGEVTDRYFDFWKTNQEQYLREIEERFAPLPVITVPLMEQEVVGIDMLKQTSGALYAGRDPTRIYFHGKAQTFDKVKGQYILSFDFPYSSKDDIDLSRNGDELLIKLGAYRRIIILPKTVVRLPVEGARFENGRLVIRFGSEEKSEDKPKKNSRSGG